MQRELEQKEFNQTIHFHCGCNGGAEALPSIGENGNWFIDGADTGVKAQGQDGKSAYQIAVEAGFEGTEADWLRSLQGASGEQGPQGIQGIPGPKGDKGDKGDAGLAFDVYSVEAVAVGTWIDGKTVYRRVFRYEGVVDATQDGNSVLTVVVPGSELGAFHQLIRAYGYGVNATTKKVMMLPHQEVAFSYDAEYGIVIVSNNYSKITDVVVVAEYT